MQYLVTVKDEYDVLGVTDELAERGVEILTVYDTLGIILVEATDMNVLLLESVQAVEDDREVFATYIR